MHLFATQNFDFAQTLLPLSILITARIIVVPLRRLTVDSVRVVLYYVSESTTFVRPSWIYGELLASLMKDSPYQGRYIA